MIKQLIGFLLMFWLWRVGFLVIKKRIIRMNVLPNAVGLACAIWPATLTYWFFQASSNATALWVNDKLPGSDEAFAATVEKFGLEVVDEESVDDETDVNDQVDIDLDTIPD